MTTLRYLRRLFLSAILFIIIGIAQTTPYLGLPFEPKPTFMDCYSQAKWTGHDWQTTGKTICLGR